MKRNENANNSVNDFDQACQALANLIGTSVGGQIPINQIDIDIERELNRRNISIAKILILSALLRGNKLQKELIITSIHPEDMGDNVFVGYLFDKYIEYYQAGINEESIDYENIIHKFGPDKFGKPSSNKSINGYRFTLRQITHVNPSDEQIKRAINLFRK